MSYWQQATKWMHGFMDRLNKQESIEMVLLSYRWQQATQGMDRRLRELAELPAPSPNQIQEALIYRELLRTSQTQVERFSRDASMIIRQQQQSFGEMGLEATQGAIRMIRVDFRRLPVEAVNRMIGHTSDGHPLYDILIRDYPKTIDSLTNTLITNTARGINPRVTARAMKADMDGNLTRALRIARTEQMYVFREASLDQMKESGVVSGWKRIEQPDACPECAEVNGEIYDLDEIFDSHPNCRGTALPVI